MQNKKRGSWANYETCLVGMWIDKEESSRRYWQEQAAENRVRASQSVVVKQGLVDAHDKTQTLLASQLCEELHDGVTLNNGSLYSDPALLGAWGGLLARNRRTHFSWFAQRRTSAEAWGSATAECG